MDRSDELDESQTLRTHRDGDVLPIRNPLRGSDVDELISVLRHGSEVDRFHAAVALGELGPSAVEALPALTSALDDESRAVRYFSAQALGNVARGAPAAINRLLHLLANENDSSTSSPAVAAGRALHKLAMTNPDQVLPILLTELQTDNEKIRNGVAQALIHLGRKQPEMLSSYVDGCLNSNNSELITLAQSLFSRPSE